MSIWNQHGIVRLLKAANAKKIEKMTTLKNPRDNAVHESVHLLMCKLLRTEEQVYVPKKYPVSRELRKLTQRVAFAIRATVNTISKYSPGQLVFQRDMIVHQR